MSSILTVLIVDDEPGIRRSLGEALAEENYGVLKVERGEQAISLLSSSDSDSIHIVLLDVWLPGIDGLETLQQLKSICPELPIIMISGHGNIDTAMKAVKFGAFDFLEKPIDLDRLLLVVKNALKQRHLEEENKRLHLEINRERFFMAEGRAMKRLLVDLDLVAPTEGRVLLVGENGSGKEEIARLIHKQSSRAKMPFVEVNCAAIPEELIESELFGHIKGAFTSAIADKNGKFREANNGTLFLDEIADMSIKTQSKVLRALQEERIEPVGGGTSIAMNVRIISATNKDLVEEIRSGRFREDLYFRLAVVPLYIPPLRERQDELIQMAEVFIEIISRKYGRPLRRLNTGAREALLCHDWPGNVRELKNVMERAIILTRGSEITARDLGPLAMRNLTDMDTFLLPEFSNLREAKDWFETNYIQREIKRYSNMTRVAERLGLDRSNLYKRLKALGLEIRES